MHHLSLEALARLVDEAALPDEAAHLRDCLVCRRELDGLREQTFALAEMPVLEPAPAAWGELEARLLADGLITRPAPAAAPRRSILRLPGLRVAASLALFLTGGIAGAMAWGSWRGTDPAPQVADSTLPAADALPATGTRPSPGTDARLAAQPLPVSATSAAAGSDVRLAANRPDPDPPARRRTPASPAVQRAERELEDAEAAYLGALRRYAEIADPASGEDPLTRLEALDRLVEMSARALDRAPGDPQLNGYHLAALNERDALRRQIQRAAETTWF